jgi:hypothetical protein
MYQSIDPMKTHMSEKTSATDFEARRVDMRVLLLKVDCDFDLRFGTDDSIDFIRFYASITDTAFIFSNWRYVIEYKWLKVRPLFWMVTLYHTVETCAVFCAIFMPDPGFFMYLAMIMVAWIGLFRLCFSVLLRIDKFVMNGRVNSPVGFFLILTALIVTQCDLTWPESINQNVRNFFQVVGVTYSGATFFYCLVNLEPARHLVVMVITIMVEMIDVLLILGILTVITGFLHFKVNPHETIVVGLKNAVQSVFGGVAADDSIMVSWVNFLVILINGIMIPIIMINFIIAKMAEAYKRLEKSQKAISLQSRCQAVLEVEYIANRISKALRLHNRCTQRQREESQKDGAHHPVYTFLAVNPELFESSCFLHPEQFNQSKTGVDGIDKAAAEEMADLRRMVNTLVVGVDELGRKIDSFRSKDELSSQLALSFGK